MNQAGWQFFNILLLGVAFMLLFTAFQTCGMIEETVLKSWEHDSSNTNSSISGYYSLSIIYASFAVCNWVAPSIVSILGPQISMILGAIIYTGFIASFLYIKPWLLYFGSGILGLAAAVIWTAQGNFLTINSNKETIGRNSGVFWALLQCSLLFGNIYVYFSFAGEEYIEDKTRKQVFTILTAVAIAGVITFFIILSTKFCERKDELTMTLINDDSDGVVVNDSTPSGGPLDALVQSFKLFKQPEMMLLSVCFFYTGLELTFFSGVYGTCLGNTGFWGDSARSMIGLSGMLIGVGEIIGGCLFGLLGQRTNKYGRDPIVLLGFLVHVSCFYLVFLNLPTGTPIDRVYDYGILNSPNKIIALVCAFLLGFGDACFNTQIYSLLGDVYSNNSAPAFAMFKFVQSVSAAIGFFYSAILQLYYQLAIVVVFATLGTLCFFIVQWNAHAKSKQEPDQQSQSS